MSKCDSANGNWQQVGGYVYQDGNCVSPVSLCVEDGIPSVAYCSAPATIIIPIDSRPPGPDYTIEVYHWQPRPLPGTNLPGRWVALATTMRDAGKTVHSASVKGSLSAAKL